MHTYEVNSSTPFLLKKRSRSKEPLLSMPILVKDYTWRETDHEVSITIPLKGVKSSKADIFSTNRYIKVNFPPYLFEVHLHAPILEEKCTVKVGNGVVNFILMKEEQGIWQRLESEDSESKELMIEKRAEAAEHAQKAAAKLAEEKAKKKKEEETFAIKQEMKLEEEERERIEQVKTSEKERTERELEEWKNQKSNSKMDKKTSKNVPFSTTKKSDPKTGNGTTGEGKSIWTKSTSSKPKAPPPRKGGSIQVRFTPRMFPTAARESKEQEEQEWLTKMAAARKISTSKADDSTGETINERNPEFLKDKGVEFFKNGDYQAAINAFSEGIKLNPNLPQLFSNRAACCLAMGEDEKCALDCCRALELYYPVVPSNYAARTKVFVRRGTAYANQGKLDLAVQDYSAALKLSPHDEDLKEDYAKLKMALQNQETM